MREALSGCIFIFDNVCIKWYNRFVYANLCNRKELTMKKKLWLTLTVLMLTTVLFTALAFEASAADTVASGTCGVDGDNLTWTLDSEGTLTISGEGAMADWSYFGAPWYSYSSSIKTVVIGDSVTSIGKDAFSSCKSLISVTIGDSVTSIGDYAFNICSSLASVTIPDSVTSIGTCAFAWCDALTSVTIGDSVTSIGDNAFFHCGLKSVTIPDSVTSIGEYAFYNCGLKSVTICNNATSIGNYAFTYSANDFTIYGYTVSTARTYASARGYAFVPLDFQPFNIFAANMTLGNELSMNFYIPAAELWGTDYYAVITKHYADGREPVVKTVPYAEWVAFKSGNKDLWKISFNGIAAKEMADLITVQVFSGKDQAVSNLWEDGVREYIMRNLDKTTFKAEQKVWAVECLNYGAASQTNFNYNTADLANNRLTEAHKALGLADVEMNDYRVLGANAKASNLSLESNISLTIYFERITDPSTKYAVVTFTDHNGNTKEVRVEGSAFKKNGSLYGVPVNMLVAADARQPVMVTLYNANGTVHGICVDSVESYSARMSTGDDLYEAVMKFATASYNMFH